MPLAISPRLVKRTISAIVLITVIVACILAMGLPFILMIVTLALVSLYEWIHLARLSKHKITLSAAGIVYVSFAYWCCYTIGTEMSMRYALLFVVMVWASDIGGYTLGKLVGGPKLAARLSPNKTWAGLTGAMVFPALAANIYAGIWDHFYGAQGWSILALAALGLVIGLVGQAGDLMISGIKRHVQVKDTGTIIPGHGGLLDRVDALLLAAPVYLFLIVKFQHVIGG